MEELNEKFNMPDGEMYLADLFFSFFFFSIKMMIIFYKLTIRH